MRNNSTLFRAGSLGVQTLVSMDVEGLAAKSSESRSRALCTTSEEDGQAKCFDIDPKFAKEPLAWLSVFAATDEYEQALSHHRRY